MGVLMFDTGMPVKSIGTYQDSKHFAKTEVMSYCTLLGDALLKRNLVSKYILDLALC